MVPSTLDMVPSTLDMEPSLYIFECNRYCCQLPDDCFVRSLKLRFAKIVFELVWLQKSILYTYIHTYIHTYTHTYIHTYTHKYIHTRPYRDVGTWFLHRGLGTLGYKVYFQIICMAFEATCLQFSMHFTKFPKYWYLRYEDTLYTLCGDLKLHFFCFVGTILVQQYYGDL